jgi:adenylate cyclase
LTVRRCANKRDLSQELAHVKILREELDQAYTKLEQIEEVRETFGQFVTPEVAQFVLAHPDDFWKRGERRIVSVLFADVRNFTPFSARVQPEEVVSALNDIFVLVIDAIQEEGGILNKFVGDGLMALFGVPVPNADHAPAAARAALRARCAVEALAESRRKLGQEPLRIGIGLNTGEVVAGCIGTKDRTEYSVIGHVVNLCARLEEIAAPGQILLGPGISGFLRESFDLSGTVTLKMAGIPEPVPVTELIAEKLVG